MHETHAVDPTPFWKRRRYFVVMMAFFGLFNVYALRVNLSVAIVAMTENRTVVQPDGHITYEQYFDWSSKLKGYILSSFFYGYLCTQVNINKFYSNSRYAEPVFIGNWWRGCRKDWRKSGKNLRIGRKNVKLNLVPFFKAFRHWCGCYSCFDSHNTRCGKHERVCFNCRTRC